MAQATSYPQKSLHSMVGWLDGGTCTTRKQLGVCTGSFLKSGRPETDGSVPVFLRTKTKGTSSVWDAPVALG